jgi:hypothetical protein
MKIDVIIKDVGNPADVRRAFENIFRALSHGLAPEDNFAGGGTVGQVLTSTGPHTPPQWKDLP